MPTSGSVGDGGLTGATTFQSGKSQFYFYGFSFHLRQFFVNNFRITSLQYIIIFDNSRRIIILSKYFYVGPHSLNGLVKLPCLVSLTIGMSLGSLALKLIMLFSSRATAACTSSEV